MNKMNIILVIFDSLRKDCVSVYGAPPWGKVHTPNFDAFAKESVIFTRAYPESLPTLPVRRAIYTGQRCYPFFDGDINLKGDFVGAPGWGPIPEEQNTLSEILRRAGYRTCLISDVFHMFKPSKNFWRGFDQWTFLRGKEGDPARSGPYPTQAEIDYWFPKEMQSALSVRFASQCILNMRDRTKEEDYFVPKIMAESIRWLEQNRDADKTFLTIESFDPHEPWFVPQHYRKMYLDKDGREQVFSVYRDVPNLDPALIERTRANYSGLVTMCDRWFGYFMEALRVMGRLENTLIIFTSDHGHSIGDGNYLGKRGYPSAPEVIDLPLMVRFPNAKHAGLISDIFLQHTDITASILDAAKVKPPAKIHGKPLLKNVIEGKPGERDHVTIGFGIGVTVVTEKWWLNCKVDGTGVFLYDLKASQPFAKNIAKQNMKVVKDLFAKAKADAGGKFPGWLLKLARENVDAPGCSDLVGRK